MMELDPFSVVTSVVKNVVTFILCTVCVVMRRGRVEEYTFKEYTYHILLHK